MRLLENFWHTILSGNSALSLQPQKFETGDFLVVPETERLHTPALYLRYVEDCLFWHLIIII